MNHILQNIFCLGTDRKATPTNLGCFVCRNSLHNTYQQHRFHFNIKPVWILGLKSCVPILLNYCNSSTSSIGIPYSPAGIQLSTKGTIKVLEICFYYNLCPCNIFKLTNVQLQRQTRKVDSFLGYQQIRLAEVSALMESCLEEQGKCFYFWLSRCRYLAITDSWDPYCLPMGHCLMFCC